MKILLAEDEVQLANVFRAALTHQGYVVDVVHNGQDALEASRENRYDVMIFDVMMPVMTGLEALRELRASGDETHVIMLTAMGEIDDKITGLDAGADDYLTKPIALKELLARLRSLERRVEMTFSQQTPSFGNVKLNVAEQELVAANSVRLASKETKLMTLLLLNQGKQLSTQEIYQYVWADEADTSPDLVYVYISYLRQKLQAVRADIRIEGEANGSYQLVQD